MGRLVGLDKIGYRVGNHLTLIYHRKLHLPGQFAEKG